MQRTVVCKKYEKKDGLRNATIPFLVEKVLVCWMVEKKKWRRGVQQKRREEKKERGEEGRLM